VPDKKKAGPVAGTSPATVITPAVKEEAKATLSPEKPKKKRKKRVKKPKQAAT
jgi:hypothetical protein